MSIHISLFATANRPQNWMSLYSTLSDSSVSFELVFVGPNEPSYVLPGNFKYVKSNVKPAQCCEIASRYTSGEVIVQVADDIEFKTKDALGKLYRMYDACKTVGNGKLILSCRYMVNGVDVSAQALRFFYNNAGSPAMPVGLTIARSTYMELGGLDRNFIAIHGELDLTMRLYAAGGKVALSNVFANEDKNKSEGSRLCDEYWYHDRKLFEQLWVVDNRVQFRRALPFTPFSDERILEESQGPKGRWD